MRVMIRGDVKSYDGINEDACPRCGRTGTIRFTGNRSWKCNKCSLTDREA